MNRLFFAARNLAIDSLLRGLEVELLRQGFPAECAWHEASAGAPRLELCMRNLATDSWEKGTCTVHLTRSSEKAPSFLSDCVYEAATLAASEYWRGKQPAKLLAFREAVQELWDSGELARRVFEVNYPFQYPSHSVF